MPDVLFHDHAPHCRVASRPGKVVEEVGIIKMSLKLTDIAIKLVHSPLVRRGTRALIAASPLAEHACAIAIVLHNLGKDNVGAVIRLLTDHGIISIVSIFDRCCLGPVLSVATDPGVTRVLARHQAGP